MARLKYSVLLSGCLMIGLLVGCNLTTIPEVVMLPSATPTTTGTPSLTPTLTLTATEAATLTSTPAPTLTPTPLIIVPSATATPTPAPPTPTPSPLPYVAAGRGGLRLRQFPETGVIMLTLKEFTPLEVQGRTVNGWLLVKIPEGFEGWVSSQYIEGLDINTVPLIENPEPVVYVAPTPPPDAPNVTSNITGGARAIYVQGQAMGNRRNVFALVGDSITDTPFFLRQFPVSYNLGEYGYLLPTLQYYMQVSNLPATSFDHLSVTARSGWSSITVLDHTAINPAICQQGETPLDCELRTIKPAIALIMIGTNDMPNWSAADYGGRLAQIVEKTMQHGVVPVLSTVPPRLDFLERSQEYNQVIVQTAQRYDIPLWDLYTALQALPNQGLDQDGVHLSVPWEAGAPASTTDFSPANLQYGTTLRNLTALQMLDTLLKQVMY